MPSRLILRILLIGLAVGVLVFGLTAPQFRNSENDLKGAFCITVSLASALLLFALSAGTSYQNSAAWLALAICGHAASLQWIDAGPRLHYQHYRSLRELLRPAVLPATVIWGVQLLMTVAGIFAWRHELRNWITRNLRWWQCAGIAIVLIAPAATLSRDPAFYVEELAISVMVQAVALGTIILAGLHLPPSTALPVRFARYLGDNEPTGAQPRVDGFATSIASIVVVASGVLGYFVYQHHPHIPDEVVYLLEARYLAAGHLVLPPVAAPDAINLDLTVYEKDRWFVPVPPGWPAVLAIGAFFGLPWLVNPLLAGLNILLIYSIVWRLYSRRIARIGIVLLAVSPWYVFMGMNFMTHMLTTTFALLAALFVALAREKRHLLYGLLAGASMGAGTLVRPLDGLIAGIAVGLWALGLGAKRLSIPALAAVFAGGAIVTASQLPYNKFLTGNAFSAPIVAYTEKYYGPKTNEYGFGPERGLGWALDPYPGHTPKESVINANLNLSTIDYELFGWGTGSLLLAAFLLFSGRMIRRDYGMYGAVALVILAYSGYWYSGGPEFAARYWYLVLVPLVALTARGIEALEQSLPPAQRYRVSLAVCGLCLMAVLNYFPWRSIDKYRHFLFMRPDMREIAIERKFGKSLIFVRGYRHPDYASAAAYNPLDFNADVPLYAWDESPSAREHALAAYPGRPVWFVDGPTITGGGYRVVEGPIPASRANAEATGSKQ